MQNTTCVVNRHSDPYDMYIGRGTPFGNPFMIGTDGGRDEVIAKFQDYFHERIKTDARFRLQVLKLQGKRLGCSCKPRACHGDVIKAYLDGLSARRNPQAVLEGFEAYAARVKAPAGEFAVKAVDHTAHLTGKTGPYVCPPEGVIKLYYTTPLNPRALTSTGLRARDKGVYAYQAPPVSLRRRYTVEFEANIDTGEMVPADRSARQAASTLYAMPQLNCVVIKGTSFRGVWVSQGGDISPERITLIRDNWTAEIVYDRSQGGWLENTRSAHLTGVQNLDDALQRGYSLYADRRLQAKNQAADGLACG